MTEQKYKDTFLAESEKIMRESLARMDERQRRLYLFTSAIAIKVAEEMGR